MKERAEAKKTGTAEAEPIGTVCHCLAVRQAARRVTQLYDQVLATSGLRVTQFSVLAALKRLGPLTINALAAQLVMDRTTLGRNIVPLERDGLIIVGPGASDRRVKEIRLTDGGRQRLRAAVPRWEEAQGHVESSLGRRRARAIRALLHTVAASDFGVAEEAL